MFLEGWIYTQAAAEASDDVYTARRLVFPRRVALNNAIFQWAYPVALQIAAQRYGVRYLLVDRVHNTANPRLDTIARLVFSDGDAAVYAVPRGDLEPTPRADADLHRRARLDRASGTTPAAARSRRSALGRERATVP